MPEFLNRYPDTKEEKFDAYLSYLKSTHFFYRIAQDRDIDSNIIKDQKHYGYPSEFIELLLKYFSVKFQSFEEFQYIWGDKTPLYVQHIDLLKEVFPDAQFIHIIRDSGNNAFFIKNDSLQINSNST